VYFNEEKGQIAILIEEEAGCGVVAPRTQD